MGFPLGKEGEPLMDGEDEEEVVGLDFVADEQTVSFGRCLDAKLTLQDGHISTPTRTVITQISEMGVMYRKVTAFTRDQEKRKGMIEQASLLL